MPRIVDSNAVRRTRHGFFRRMTLVSRRFYHLLRPSFYSHLDLSSFTNSYYGTHTIFTAIGRLLARKASISLPSSHQMETPDEVPISQANGQSTNTTTSRLDGPPPRKKKRVGKKQSETTSANPLDSLPTFGELVKKVTIGSFANMPGYLDQWLASLPNLEEVFFPPKTNYPLHILSSFASKATSTLRTVDHLLFVGNGEDSVSRAEAILALFNAAPNVQRFGISGALVLDLLLGRRLAFIWRLNARLKHSPSGCLGVGLKELYFGSGVELQVEFLRALKESCPRLIK